MAISGGSIFVHYPAVQVECYLLSLILTIIDGHPRQAIGLVKLVNHILLLNGPVTLTVPFVHLCNSEFPHSGAARTFSTECVVTVQ